MLCFSSAEVHVKSCYIYLNKAYRIIQVVHRAGHEVIFRRLLGLILLNVVSSLSLTFCDVIM